MADFRKLFYALAVVVLLLSTVTEVSAQWSCQATSTPGVVRKSGITELAGDIVLDCTGATPALAGVPVSTYNFQVTLNTNVTSPLLTDPFGIGNLTEAAMLIDDPAAAAANPGAAGAAAPTPTPIIGALSAANTDYKLGVVQNIFLGRLIGTRTIQFTNIPLDPPPLGLHRFIRITNIRVDAAFIAPASLQASITISNGTTIGSSLTVTNATLNVGTPQDDVAFATLSSSDNTALTAPVGNLTQCTAVNSDLATSASATTLGSQGVTEVLRFTEGSVNSFRTPIHEVGAQYGPVGVLLPAIGAATNGTRLLAKFTNIPTGAFVYVSVSNVNSTPAPSVTARAFLKSADANGFGGAFVTVGTAGPFPVAPAGSYPTGLLPAQFVRLTVTGGTATATWEIFADDPSQIESLSFAVIVAAPSGAVLLGSPATTVTGTLGPISTIRAAAANSATLGVPRFVDSALPGQGFVFSTCVTNLLFPYVTSGGVLNTGIAISNTTSDVWGTATQHGNCVISYFGQTAGGGSVPTAQTSADVAAGSSLIFTVSGGGMGVGAAPGFSGYLIASCNFQMAHGLAFISDVNVANLAFGYLAQVIPDTTITPGPRKSTRSGPSEILGQ